MKSNTESWSKEQINDLKKIYETSLFEDLIPWWEQYSMDWEYGGYFTRLNRNGTPYSGDKDMWMTARQIWMFSHLYNQYEKKEQWKIIAKQGLDFMLEHSFKIDGKMHFRLNQEGRPISSVLSIYTEVFACIAVAEYAGLSQDADLKDRALVMYNFLLSRLGQASDTPMLGYSIERDIHLHSHDMCRMTVAKVYNDLWPSEQFEQDLTISVDSILSRHWNTDKRYLLENTAMDGSELSDIPEGRLVIPGHAIESAWMLMEIALERKDLAMFDTAIDITIASLEYGWDSKYGGLRYMLNTDGTPTHELGADLKLWWPHGEALYALLMGWLLTGREDLKVWYEKLHEYTFNHFPDEKHGEWFGYLNRDGSPVWEAKANGWKGFFHVPRVLFRCYQLLEDLAKG
nr:AGE family epimerase/isomerase [Allomuricauda sp.]